MATAHTCTDMPHSACVQEAARYVAMGCTLLLGGRGLEGGLPPHKCRKSNFKADEVPWDSVTKLSVRTQAYLQTLKARPFSDSTCNDLSCIILALRADNTVKNTWAVTSGRTGASAGTRTASARSASLMALMCSCGAAAQALSNVSGA